MKNVHYVIINPDTQTILYKQVGGGYGQHFSDTLTYIRKDYPTAVWYNVTHPKCPVWVKRECIAGYQESIEW